MNISKILFTLFSSSSACFDCFKFNELMSKVLNTFIIVFCLFSLAGSCTFRLQKNKSRLFSKKFTTNDYITVNRRIYKAASTNTTDVINWVTSTACAITIQQKIHIKVLSNKHFQFSWIIDAHHDDNTIQLPIYNHSYYFHQIHCQWSICDYNRSVQRSWFLNFSKCTLFELIILQNNDPKLLCTSKYLFDKLETFQFIMKAVKKELVNKYTFISTSKCGTNLVLNTLMDSFGHFTDQYNPFDLSKDYEVLFYWKKTVK